VKGIAQHSTGNMVGCDRPPSILRIKRGGGVYLPGNAVQKATYHGNVKGRLPTLYHTKNSICPGNQGPIRLPRGLTMVACTKAICTMHGNVCHGRHYQCMVKSTLVMYVLWLVSITKVANA